MGKLNLVCRKKTIDTMSTSSLTKRIWEARVGAVKKRGTPVILIGSILKKKKTWKGAKDRKQNIKEWSEFSHGNHTHT